jgi:hypothetical protein
MTTVLEIENNEFRKIELLEHKLLARMKKKGYVGQVSIEVQEQMLDLKDRLARMMSRIAANKRALSDLLEDDERMALMNLSALKHKPSLYRAPLTMEILSTHEETEDLMELYLLDYSSLESNVETSQARIEAAESLVYKLVLHAVCMLVVSLQSHE